MGSAKDRSIKQSAGEIENANSRKEFLNFRGTSLIEMMVAVAIGSVIIVGLTTFLELSMSSQQAVSFKTQVDALTQEMRALLGDPTACINTFNAATPAAVSLTTSLDSYRTQLRNKNNTMSYATTSTYGDGSAVLTSMQAGGTITPTAAYQTISGNEGQFKLTVLFTSTRRTNGPSTLRRTITINTLKDASNNLTYCYAAAAGSDSLWTQLGTGDIYFASGKVGVGTAAPLQKLHVTSGAYAASTPKTYSGYGIANGIMLDAYEVDSTGGWTRYADIGALAHSGSVGSHLRFLNQATGGAALTEKMRIVPSGNVGIGITNPSTALQIYSNVIPEIVSGDPLGAFSIKSTASTAMVFGVQAASPYNGHIQVRHGTVAGANYYPLSLQPLGGSVGIGLVTPTARLHVRYPGNTNPAGPGGNWAGLIDNTQDTGGNAYNGLSVATRWGGVDSTVFEAASYWSGGAEVYTPILSVKGDRTVGIGTTAPATIFHISGAHSTTRARLTLPAGNNGGGTGEVNLQLWVSEPGVTWDSGGIGTNVNNDGGANGFGRLNTSLGQALIRFITNGGAMQFNTAANDGTYFANTMYLTGGKVGIGMVTPAYPLDVAGVARAGSFLSTSDEREKEAIRTAPGLEMILDLRGVTFRWKRDHRPGMGVIAQEVEKVAPELVATDEGGRKSVNYEGLIAPLIESVKDLNRQLAELRGEIHLLKVENEKLKRAVQHPVALGN